MTLYMSCSFAAGARWSIACEIIEMFILVVHSKLWGWNGFIFREGKSFGRHFHGSSLPSQSDIGMSFGYMCLCTNNEIQSVNCLETALRLNCSLFSVWHVHVYIT